MSGLAQSDAVWGWRGAASGVVDCLKQALDSGEASDIQFAVGRDHGEEQLFQAHKLVLSLRSDVFQTMFHGELPETTERIELPDILPQAFAVLLKYLYTDMVGDLTLENVLSTMYCAKKYGIPKLVDICSEYAREKVDKDTCLAVLEAAKILDAEILVERCLEMVDANCAELLQSPGFLQLKQETLRQIFSRDTLGVREVQVYEAAQRWASNTCRANHLQPTAANCRVVLGEALLAVRFPLMNDEQLANGPLASGLLLNEELVKIYQFKYAAKKPDIPFSGAPRSCDMIAFCDHRWRIVDVPDGDGTTTASQVFLDADGHVHLRFAQHDGVWKGAAIRLLGTLGYGRHELHIEGLGRLDPNVTLAICSDMDTDWSAVALVFRPGEQGLNSASLSFLVRDASAGRDSVCNRAVEACTNTTLSCVREAHYVSFSCQRGYHSNNTEDELCNWSREFGPAQSALPLFIRLSGRQGAVPADGQPVQVILHSFRFYPR